MKNLIFFASSLLFCKLSFASDCQNLSKVIHEYKTSVVNIETHSKSANIYYNGNANIQTALNELNFVLTTGFKRFNDDTFTPDSGLDSIINETKTHGGECKAALNSDESYLRESHYTPGVSYLEKYYLFNVTCSFKEEVLKVKDFNLFRLQKICPTIASCLSHSAETSVYKDYYEKFHCNRVVTPGMIDPEYDQIPKVMAVPIPDKF